MSKLGSTPKGVVRLRPKGERERRVADYAKRHWGGLISLRADYLERYLGAFRMLPRAPCVCRTKGGLRISPPDSRS
jgi:hypothetical protein